MPQTTSFRFGERKGASSLREMVVEDPSLLRMPILDLAQRAVYNAMIDARAINIDHEAASYGVLNTLGKLRKRRDSLVDVLPAPISLDQHLRGLFRRRDIEVREDILPKLENGRWPIKSNLAALHEQLSALFTAGPDARLLAEGSLDYDQDILLIALYDEWHDELGRVIGLMGKSNG